MQIANSSVNFWSDWASFNVSIMFEDGKLVNFNPKFGGQFGTLEHYLKSDPDLEGNYLPCITLNVHNIKKKINWSDVSSIALLYNCTSKLSFALNFRSRSTFKK